MNTVKTIFCILLLNFFAISLSAQDKPIEDACPTIKMIEPESAVKPGDTLIFSVKIDGLNKEFIRSYNWSVNRGEISGGQGTAEITVDTRTLSGETVIATVSVDFSRFDGCGNEASGAGFVGNDVQAILKERVENPNCEYHMMIMDSFFVDLQNDPNATGYIIIYAGPRTTAIAERQMRSYIKVRGFPPDRLYFINGGGTSRKATIEFWIVPPGAESPMPTNPPEDDEPESVEEINEEHLDPAKPYIFSNEYYDGVNCYGESEEIDLEGYALILKENPKSRGNIVIMMTSQADFREKEKEILNYLAKKGINRKRLRTFHVKSFGGVELWYLP